MAVIPDYGGSNPPFDVLSKSALTLKPVPPPARQTRQKYTSDLPPPLISFGANSAPSSVCDGPGGWLGHRDLGGREMRTMSNSSV